MTRRSVGGKRTRDCSGDVGSSPTVSTRKRLWRLLAYYDRRISQLQKWKGYTGWGHDEWTKLDNKRREIRLQLKAR